MILRRSLGAFYSGAIVVAVALIAWPAFSDTSCAAFLTSGLYRGVGKLMQSQHFRTFLEDSGLRPVPDEYPESPRAKEIAVRYLKWVTENLSRDVLELQSDSLLKGLKRHGYKAMESEAGRKALWKLSAANVQRILQGRTYIASPEMNEAEQLVADLEFEFVHNTRNEGTHNLETPLLSSDVLQKIGLQGGRNTYTFNQSLMGSHDQVFFYVRPVTKRFRFRPTSSYYGNIALFLDPAYAESAGWISAFVMYLPQLFDATANVAPAETESAVRKFKMAFVASGRNANGPDDLMRRIDSASDRELKTFIESNLPELEALRNHLSQFDFTVMDFGRLVRTQLLISLKQLRVDDEVRFRKALEILRSEPKVDDHDQSELDRLVRDLVLTKLGLPASFELKVPIMVPAGSYFFPTQ